MRRLLFPLLMVSVGLNLGLLYHQLSASGERQWSRERRLASRESHRREPRELDPSRLVGHRMRQMEHALDLSEAQRATTRAVLERFVPQIVERRRALEDAHRNLQEELVMPDLDVARFRSRVAELNAAQSAIDSLVAEAMLEEAATLTPEQRARYLELTPFGPMMQGPMGRPRGDRPRHGPPPERGD